MKLIYFISHRNTKLTLSAENINVSYFPLLALNICCALVSELYFKYYIKHNQGPIHCINMSGAIRIPFFTLIKPLF